MKARNEPTINCMQQKTTSFHDIIYVISSKTYSKIGFLGGNLAVDVSS